jgi:hypothetical protein
MGQAPWTDIGRLQADIRALSLQISRKVELYEVDALRSNVASLERTVGELRTEIDVLRFELLQLSQEGGEYGWRCPKCKGGQDGEES